MAAAMNNVSVPKQSDEYNQIEHYLSMCTFKSGLATDLNIWRIDNAQVTSNFDRTTGGLLRLPSWVNTEDLPEDNSLDEICQYGFQLHNTSGMSFSTGNVNLVPNADLVQQLVYCELAVGRARVCDPDDITSDVVSIPEGYDSLYVPQERADRNNDGELTIEEYDAAANFDFRDPSMYNHQYFVKEGLHVNPRYIVEFVLLPKSDDNEDVSVVSCAESGGGSKKEGGSGADIPEYFDPVMYRSVSLKEKMSNVNLSRRLIPIEKAFNLAQEEAHKEDSILNSKLEWIDSKLSDVDISVRQINMNYAEQYDEIVSASERAISQLQELSKSKLELLLGVEMELRREREEIEWIEGFIATKRTQAPELCEKNRQEYLNFLNAWKSHAILRNGLSRAKPQEIDILSNITPNMVVHPEITVSTTDKLPSTLHALKERRQQQQLQSRFGDQKDEDNESSKSSAFNECLNDAKHFFNAVATNSGLYANQPAKPLESLVSPDAQALVDRNVIKIEVALKAALEDSASSSKRMIPLPDSITRPTVSGTQYPLPDPSPFKSAYNDMGNNENYTEEQLQLEMEKNIRQYARSDLQSTEGSEETHKTPPHRHTLSDLRPLAQNNPNRLQERAESMRAPFMKVPSSQQLLHSNSTPIPEYLTATEEFDGDLVSYLEHTIEQFHPTYSLDEGAKRRISQLSTTNANFVLCKESVFFESDILEPEQAESLYLNLPFFSKPPDCQFLYSSQRDGSGLELLYEALDGTKGPNVLLIQSGDFIFGAYVNQTLLPSEDNKWSGSPSCFLFSVTFDLKLPYHGRNPPGKGKMPHPCAFLADTNHLLFGNGDIQLDGELETGSSNLEGCFGLGLPRTSHATSTLLAGVNNFTIDKLEVWHVSSVI